MINKFDIILLDENKKVIEHISLSEALKEDYIIVDSKTDYLIPFDKSIILRNYTGKKDKNGKEIYNGDIVDIENEIFEVVWHDSGWFLFGLKYKSHVFSFMETEISNSEIISNIFEILK